MGIGDGHVTVATQQRQHCFDEARGRLGVNRRVPVIRYGLIALGRRFDSGFERAKSQFRTPQFVQNHPAVQMRPHQVGGKPCDGFIVAKRLVVVAGVQVDAGAGPEPFRSLRIK